MFKMDHELIATSIFVNERMPSITAGFFSSRSLYLDSETNKGFRGGMQDLIF